MCRKIMLDEKCNIFGPVGLALLVLCCARYSVEYGLAVPTLILTSQGRETPLNVQREFLVISYGGSFVIGVLAPVEKYSNTILGNVIIKRMSILKCKCARWPSSDTYAMICRSFELAKVFAMCDFDNMMRECYNFINNVNNSSNVYGGADLFLNKFTTTVIYRCLSVYFANVIEEVSSDATGRCCDYRHEHQEISLPVFDDYDLRNSRIVRMKRSGVNSPMPNESTSAYELVS